MLLAILTNIHALSGLLLVALAVIGLTCGMCYMIDPREGDRFKERLPTNAGKITLITAITLIALFCVTPSTSDVVMFNLRG